MPAIRQTLLSIRSTSVAWWQACLAGAPNWSSVAALVRPKRRWSGMVDPQGSRDCCWQATRSPLQLSRRSLEVGVELEELAAEAVVAAPGEAEALVRVEARGPAVARVVRVVRVPARPAVEVKADLAERPE